MLGSATVAAKRAPAPPVQNIPDRGQWTIKPSPRLPDQPGRNGPPDRRRRTRTVFKGGSRRDAGLPAGSVLLQVLVKSHRDRRSGCRHLEPALRQGLARIPGRFRARVLGFPDLGAQLEQLPEISLKFTAC